MKYLQRSQLMWVRSNKPALLDSEASSFDSEASSFDPVGKSDISERIAYLISDIEEPHWELRGRKVHPL
jgi:hypothetical protein